MRLLNIFAGENLSSLLTNIVLIGTNIASFVAWRSEKKKRKYNELRDKGNIVDELSQKFDAVLRDNTELKLKVSKLEFEIGQQKTAYEVQEQKILGLENENKTLRENQQKLIRENEQLKYKLDTLAYAGKKKQPVPKRKDVPCSN
jgi:predicted nuclease with TOPRIM domain